MVGTTTASRVTDSCQRRASPAPVPPSAAAIRPVSACARSSRSGRAARASPRSSAATIFASVRGPIPGTCCSRPGRGRGAQLVGRGDAERRADLHAALRAEAERVPERRQLGRHALPQLVELGDPSRLDELDQARLDPRPDSAELPDPP